MNEIDFSNLLLEEFPYKPTFSQEKLIGSLSQFLFGKQENDLFVLKGYAGTGKTTVVSSLVNNLYAIGKKFVLLAPTGRAAKVLSAYSAKKAFTIHKKIYIPSTASDGTIKLVLSINKHENTIFMVDEASMIPDSSPSDISGLFSARNLLEDLVSYVYSGKNSKLILIGDTAQLPPVGLDISPALDLNYLKSSFNLEISTYELTEVVRQSLESGILANATNIRNEIKHHTKNALIELKNFNDVFRINGEELEEALINTYSTSGKEETVIITRSNKRANIFNQEIRKRILFLENEITTGDYLMVAKNNYFWLNPESKAGFIANGDIIEIQRIHKYEDFYGFRFADVSVRLIDYPEENDLNVKIMLDTIMYDGPSLSFKDNQRLFEEILKDYDDIPSRRRRVENVKNSPFYNALQVKFAYSLTCHKTQGGQWESVFIDQGYLTEERINKEYYRWLYTAFTRATGKLYLINFNERFFI